MATRGLRNTWLVLRREYLERACSRSFVLTTLLMPAFLLGTILVPAVLSGQGGSRTRRVAIVSPDEALGKSVRDRLWLESNGTYLGRVETDTTAAERARLTGELRAGKLHAYVWLDAEALKHGDIGYFTNSPSDFVGAGLIRDAVSYAIRRRRLIARGVPPEQADSMLATVRLRTVNVGASGGAQSDVLGGMLAAFGLVFLMFITLLSYGVMVMRSVMEEKGSRVVEVLLCSLTSDELMAGKIIGTGAVGLSQAAVWTVMMVLAMPSLAAALHVGTVHLATSWFVYFAVFYVLGFLLYAAMFAAVGAAFESMEDAQQWNMVIISPLVAATVLMGPGVTSPDAPVTVVASMVPLCSPLLMYTRIVSGNPPAWQIALSIAILVVTIWFTMRLCGRIYRVGILMYGKRVRFGEIVKWLRYT
jgi:ABC-2 type transport system permease protein